MSASSDRYWERKSLEEMTPGEWESLCDGCGKCCAHKFEDPDTGEIEYSTVACRQLDLKTARCKNYPQRRMLVPSCVCLTPETVRTLHWLPDTCAYRLVAEGKPLHDWHPLVSGDPDSTRKAGISIIGRAISEDDAEEFQVARRFGILE